MLLQLSIHHLALINDMTIDFEPGMNVMTGKKQARANPSSWTL